MIIVHACTMIIVKQMHNPVNNPVVEMSYRMILPNHRMPSCNPVFVPQHDYVITRAPPRHTRAPPKEIWHTYRRTVFETITSSI